MAGRAVAGGVVDGVVGGAVAGGAVTRGAGAGVDWVAAGALGMTVGCCPDTTVGVGPGWPAGAFWAGILGARANTDVNGAELTGGGLEAGRSEAGSAVTPWRYASAIAVTVLT